MTKFQKAYSIVLGSIIVFLGICSIYIGSEIKDLNIICAGIPSIIVGVLQILFVIW